MLMTPNQTFTSIKTTGLCKNTNVHLYIHRGIIEINGVCGLNFLNLGYYHIWLNNIYIII